MTAGIGLPFTVDADLDLGRSIEPWLRGPGADVCIRRGTVPIELTSVEQEGGSWQCAEERALLRGPRGMAALVESGRSVVYAAPPDAAPLDVRLFLMGTPWIALALQRGLLPLHASAVATGREVHAFGGPSGAGKSTLVAALSLRDHAFFADDSLLLDIHQGEGETSCYAYKDLKLDRAGADLANVPLGVRSCVAKGHRKHYVALPRRSPHVVGRLKTLTLLGRRLGRGDTLASLTGRRALYALYRSIHRPRLVADIAGPRQLRNWMVELVGRIEVRVFLRSFDEGRFHTSLATIAAACRQRTRMVQRGVGAVDGA